MKAHPTGYRGGESSGADEAADGYCRRNVRCDRSCPELRRIAGDRRTHRSLAGFPQGSAGIPGGHLKIPASTFAQVDKDIARGIARHTDVPIERAAQVLARGADEKLLVAA